MSQPEQQQLSPEEQAKQDPNNYLIAMSEDKFFNARQHFKKHGWVAIPDFFNPNFAANVRGALYHNNLTGVWTHAAQFENGKGAAYTPDVPKNALTVAQNRATAQKRQGGCLHYSFTRTLDDANENNFVMNKIVSTMQINNGLLELLAKITDLPVEKIETIFASKYVTGDFLDWHTDAADDSRQLAFVWALSQDWKEAYGGVLEVDGAKLVPTFNTFTIFDVRNGGRSHRVTDVTDATDEPRLSISGWLGKK